MDSEGTRHPWAKWCFLRRYNFGIRRRLFYRGICISRFLPPGFACNRRCTLAYRLLVEVHHTSGHCPSPSTKSIRSCTAQILGVSWYDEGRRWCQKPYWWDCCLSGSALVHFLTKLIRKDLVLLAWIRMCCTWCNPFWSSSQQLPRSNQRPTRVANSRDLACGVACENIQLLL